MNDIYVNDLGMSATQKKRTSFYIKRVLLLAALVLLAASGVRALVNIKQADALQEYTTQTLEHTVLTTKAKPGDLQRTLSLPASLRGYNESIIYARTTGYVSAWKKGIGDQVKKGDLLAVLDAPEQEQELAQARAQREQIAAQSEFVEQTLARWEGLKARQSPISEQDLAEKRSLFRQSKADVLAADANMKRLEQLQSFRRITAPFNGILTRRSIEVGDLIANTGKELFAITQTDPLRLTIWVPQAYAMNLKVGTQVNVSVAEQPSAKLHADIERIAGGIDPSTRARQVDLILQNPDGKLLPGAYAEVSIRLQSDVKALVAPAAVLIVTDQTQRVAVVDADNKIQFRVVKLGRDLGRDVELLEGVSADDTLVVSPSDQLVDGEKVARMEWKPTATEPTSSAPKEAKENKLSKEK